MNPTDCPERIWLFKGDVEYICADLALTMDEALRCMFEAQKFPCAGLQQVAAPIYKQIIARVIADRAGNAEG